MGSISFPQGLERNSHVITCKCLKCNFVPPYGTYPITLPPVDIYNALCGKI